MSGELQAKSWSPAYVAVPLRLVGKAVQADGLTLTSTAGLGNDNGQATLRGMVRPQGRHWFILTLPRPLGEGSLEVGLGQHRRSEIIRIEERKVTTYANREGVVIPSGPKKILILIDFTDPSNLATVRAMGLSQGSETTLATVNIPVDSTDLGLILNFFLWTGLRDTEGQSVTISTDKSLSPVQIPIGYEPLAMVSATVDSAIEKPALLQADRDGVYDDYVFRKGSQFLWLVTGLQALQPVGFYPTSKDDATIDGARSFNKPIVVQGMEIRADLRNLTVRRPPTAAPVRNGYTLLNTSNLPVFANGHVVGPIMGQAVKLRDTVAMGDGFFGALNVTESAVVTMSSGGAAEVIRAALFGTNLLPQLASIKRSTVLGNGIGKVARVVEDSVLAGNELAEAMSEIYQSVVVGAKTHNVQQKVRNVVTIGHGAARNALADGGVLVGYRAGYSGTAANAVAVGNDAGTILFERSVAIGANAQAAGADAMQLGSNTTRAVSHHGFNVRADERDVGKRRDPQLGLDFIRGLKVEEIAWNHRDAYIDTLPEPPAPLGSEPQAPTLQPTDVGYQQALLDYQEASRLWLIDRDRYSEQSLQYATAIERCMRQRKLRDAAPELSKISTNYELVILAESVELAARKVGATQSIITDYSAGGQQVKTRDDGQLLAAVVRSVQELDQYVHSDGFANKVAAAQMKALYRQ